MIKEICFCDNCKKQVDHVTFQELYLKYWFGQGLMSKTPMELCDDCLEQIADKLAEIPWIKDITTKRVT